jgi:S-adenosylmethionine:tRNA-ribosyltransferase-isomerase (queuine synthetase)
MLDYEMYNVHPGQLYARADDPLQVPTLEVIDVLDYAERGDCIVKDLNGTKMIPARIFTIDCFKLSKVRYNLLTK